MGWIYNLPWAVRLFIAVLPIVLGICGLVGTHRIARQLTGARTGFIPVIGDGLIINELLGRGSAVLWFIVSFLFIFGVDIYNWALSLFGLPNWWLLDDLGMSLLYTISYIVVNLVTVIGFILIVRESNALSKRYGHGLLHTVLLSFIVTRPIVLLLLAGEAREQ